MLYLWMKWLHIIAVISWMAGILYLFRLLIYHCERYGHQAVHELLSLMEYRLYRYITVPAMVTSAVAGLSLLYLSPEFLKMGWLHLKVTLVLLLVASTLQAGSLVKRAAKDPKSLPSSKSLRIANEVPTILMMLIVGLVVFKAF